MGNKVLLLLLLLLISHQPRYFSDLMKSELSLPKRQFKGTELVVNGVHMLKSWTPYKGPKGCYTLVTRCTLFLLLMNCQSNAMFR